jgi:hypothetical protein
MRSLRLQTESGGANSACSRDREKRGGDGRGTGFLNWLKSREISKSQAYSLIELANSADTLLAEGKLSTDASATLAKRAFVETAKSAPEGNTHGTEAAEIFIIIPNNITLR